MKYKTNDPKDYQPSTKEMQSRSMYNRCLREND